MNERGSTVVCWKLWQTMPPGLVGPRGGRPGLRVKEGTRHGAEKIPAVGFVPRGVMGSLRPETTCFLLPVQLFLLQGEASPLQTREPSCVWVLQAVSRFPSDVSVCGKVENTASS